MLVPVQPSGSKPPLYFVHGLIGVMPIGRFLKDSLGPEQPVYAVLANGMDGREAATGNLKDMARAYAEEILATRPRGPLVIGGMCTGGLAAIEVARELQARGEELGPLILADPPTVPPGYIRQNHGVDPRNPLIASQLYERVRGQLLNHALRPYNDLRFASDDKEKVHFATLAGVNSLVALSTHVPEPFPGAAAAILSAERAAGFFHPQMHWIKLLPRKLIAHVLPCNHMEVFRSARHDFVRVLKFILDNDVNFKIRAEATTEASVGLTDEFANEFE
jgi:thioesterase domain-containing protein